MGRAKIGHSKKVPLSFGTGSEADYTSKSYWCEEEVDLPDNPDEKARARALIWAEQKEAIDAEIRRDMGDGAVTGQFSRPRRTNDPPPVQTEIQHQPRPNVGGGRRFNFTEKQKSMLSAIIKELRLEATQIAAMLQDMFGKRALGELAPNELNTLLDTLNQRRSKV